MFTKLRDRVDKQTGFVTVGLVAAVTAAMMAFLLGQGATNHVLKLLPGGMWLLNQAGNTASHINGTTGVKDGEWAIRTGPGRNVQTVIDVEGSLIAIDDQGNAHMIDAAVGPKGQTSQSASGYQLFVGTSTVYAVQMPVGDVQARSGVSGGLESLGAPVNLGGRIHSGAVAEKDVLITTVPEHGKIVSVDQVHTSSQQAFTPNSNAKVVAVRGKPVLVDLTAGLIRTLDGSAPEINFDPTGATSETVVNGCDSCSGLVIGKGRSVVAADLSTSTVREISLDLAGGVQVDQAVIGGDHAYARTTDGQALKIGVLDGKVERVGGSTTFTDIHASGGNVYLNDARGDKALTVGKDGNPKEVVKYTAESTQQAKQEAEADPQPTPEPSPAPSKKPRKPKSPETPKNSLPTPAETQPAPEPSRSTQPSSGNSNSNTGSGPSAPSESESAAPAVPADPTPTPTLTPSAPGVSAAPAGRGEIKVTVTWNATKANGATIDRFVVELGGDSKVLSAAQLASGTAGVTFDGLADSRTYTAKVTVSTSQGVKVSATDSATTNDPPAPRTYWFRVQDTSKGGGTGTLQIKSGASSGSSTVGSLNEGDAIGIICQVAGENFHYPQLGTSQVWDKLPNGTYVSDLFVSTGGYYTFDPNLPRCESM